MDRICSGNKTIHDMGMDWIPSWSNINKILDHFKKQLDKDQFFGTAILKLGIQLARRVSDLQE